MKKLSLASKLMIGISITGTAIIILLTVYNSIKAIREYEGNIKAEVGVLSSAIALTSSEFVWNLNNDALKKITELLIANESIEAIQFLDNKNTLLTSSEKESFKALKEEVKKQNKISTKITYGKDNQEIGLVEIYYNLNKISKIKSELIKEAAIIIIIALLMQLTVIWILLKVTVKNISLITTSLKGIVENTNATSESVRAISEEVSSSSVEQAASVQETVATLDQISSMVNTAVDGAQNSANKAEESHNIASEGKVVVKEMINAMEDIDQSNKNIMEEISKSNERIASIVKVIDEISQKTTVINDIVFQTKLLSFNASVEAARAGEHGKGFAVVAEEVGNLAQMSGKASNEISQMLQDSINRVNGIISETNQNIKRLIDTGNEKVKRGVDTADRCGKILDDVVDNAAIVKTMMNEVFVASKEQAEGVKNISLAMNQIDQTTNANTNAANKSFENAKALSIQSEELKSCVDNLETELFGGVNKSPTVDTKSGSNNILKFKEKKENLAKSNVVSISTKKVVNDHKNEVVTKNNGSKSVATITALPQKTKSPNIEIKINENKKTEEKEISKIDTVTEEKKSNQIGLPAHNDPRFEDV